MMTPEQLAALVQAFGLSCDGLVRCRIDIERTHLTATCVYLRDAGPTADTATEVVRQFNLQATPAAPPEPTP